MERNLFKRRRTDLEKTQRAIARELELMGHDYTSAAIGSWERDISFPDVSAWEAIEKVYGVTRKQLSDAAVNFKRPIAA